MIDESCKACRVSVRISDSEVRRIIAEHFGYQGVELASDEEVARRLALCDACDALRYGTTCAHCGCLVPVIARLARKTCPHPTPRW